MKRDDDLDFFAEDDDDANDRVAQALLTSLVMLPGLAPSVRSAFAAVVDVPATLDATRLLDLLLVACDGSVARGIVMRAITHLENSLNEHLTGPK